MNIVDDSQLTPEQIVERMRAKLNAAASYGEQNITVTVDEQRALLDTLEAIQTRAGSAEQALLLERQRSAESSWPWNRQAAPQQEVGQEQKK